MTTIEIRAAVAAEPWLEPFVEDGDTDPDKVRRRFRVSQAAALRRLERDGVKLHRRVAKKGMLTTALDGERGQR